RDDRPTVALRLARPARTSLDDLAANARLLARLDGDVTALLDGSGLDPAEFEQARVEVGAAARAKRLLREWRAVVGEDPRRAATLLLEVLRVRPGDLEAAARLGRAPQSVPSLAASEDEAALEILEDRTAAKDLAELCRALERAGTSTAIPAAS